MDSPACTQLCLDGESVMRSNFNAEVSYNKRVEEVWACHWGMAWQKGALGSILTCATGLLWDFGQIPSPLRDSVSLCLNEGL